jgi:hypothetical protein
MATKIDVSGLTLNPQEATEVSQAVMELVFVQNELSQYHEIQTGIQNKQQIPFVGQLGIGGEALNGCTPAEQDALDLTQKYWDPALIAGRFSHCQNDLNNLLKLFRKAQRANPDYFDKTGSEEMQLLMAKISESIKTSVNAKIWYSDLTAAVISGGGTFTNGTNLNLFNQFDGLWKQIFADATVKRFEITENSGANYDLQELASGKGYSILKSIYNGSDTRLKGADNKYFKVTQSVYDNYYDYLETTEQSGGNLILTQGGVTTLTYRNIPVVAESEWDRLQNLYQNDGTKVNLPHRAILTVAGNVPVGTLNDEDMTTLESWYEKKDKANYVDFSYFLDAKMLEPYMISVAY